jgi:hypothetical protein
MCMFVRMYLRTHITSECVLKFLSYMRTAPSEKIHFLIAEECDVKAHISSFPSLTGDVNPPNEVKSRQ